MFGHNAESLSFLKHHGHPSYTRTSPFLPTPTVISIRTSLNTILVTTGAAPVTMSSCVTFSQCVHCVGDCFLSITRANQRSVVQCGNSPRDIDTAHFSFAVAQR